MLNFFLAITLHNVEFNNTYISDKATINMAALDSSKRRGDNVRTRKSEFQRGNIFNAPSMGSMQDVLHKKMQTPSQQPKSEQTTAVLTKALSSHFLFVSLHPREVAELVEAMTVEVCELSSV
jgi:Fic family protein